MCSQVMNRDRAECHDFWLSAQTWVSIVEVSYKGQDFGPLNNLNSFGTSLVLTNWTIEPTHDNSVSDFITPPPFYWINLSHIREERLLCHMAFIHMHMTSLLSIISLNRSTKRTQKHGTPLLLPYYLHHIMILSFLLFFSSVLLMIE